MEAHVMLHVWPKICHVCLVEHEVERCKRRVVLLVLESGGHDTACGQGEARARPRSLGGSAGSRKNCRQNGGRGAEKPIDIPAATGK